MAKRATKVDHAKRLQARRIVDLRAVNLQDELAVLETGQDIEITRSGEARGEKKVAEDVARRLDVFLSIDMSKAAYEAARRLERDMLINRGDDDRTTILIVVDNSRPDRGGAMDRKLAAGDRVRAALKLVGMRDCWLLTELINPAIYQPWRQIVARITGEENPVAQATSVRGACANLAEAYAEIDR